MPLGGDVCLDSKESHSCACKTARFGTPVPISNPRENIMNYALIEYLATCERRQQLSAERSAPLKKEAVRHERQALTDRILRWWLRRSTWRLVRLRS